MKGKVQTVNVSATAPGKKEKVGKASLSEAPKTGYKNKVEKKSKK